MNIAFAILIRRPFPFESACQTAQSAHWHSATNEYCICSGQVQLATVYGPVWNLDNQNKHGFRVSDGFCFRWIRRILAVFVFADRSCRMPRCGTVEFGVVCDGLGTLSFFVLRDW